MGKKRSRAHQVSKGERNNVSKSITKAARKEYMQNDLVRGNNQMKAWKLGKNVVLTVPNRGGDKLKAPFIKVNARDYWGNPNAKYTMKSTPE